MISPSSLQSILLVSNILWTSYTIIIYCLLWNDQHRGGKRYSQHTIGSTRHNPQLRILHDLSVTSPLFLQAMNPTLLGRPRKNMPL